MIRSVRRIRGATRALLLALLCAGAAACGRAPAESADPVEVSAADDIPSGEVAESDQTSPPDDTAPPETVSPTNDGAGTGGAGGGGLRVVDGNGELVGILVSRGHSLQGQQGADPLRDGVLVYHPGARLFFGVAMVSGKVLVPRLGIADPKCDQPLVAGYYADGPEVAGFDYGFAWRGTWWRIKGGEPLALVGCSGVVTGGETPKCVPHNGSCRGFPVESMPATGLPQSFSAPLHFDWQGAGG
ncbi:MAG: hypothetical protein RIT45_3796 [Pseudomonadota bacterium]